MKIQLKDVNDDLTITRGGGVSIRVFDFLSSLRIPVEGDIQIFDNPECTRYAAGIKNPGDKIYARINRPWGFGEEWNIVSEQTGSCINCSSPTDEYPEGFYFIQAWIDFSCLDYDEPFTAGQVVELTSGMKNVDVTNYQKVFYKPTN